MSFGFSPSDIVALINIVSKTYQGWKSACGEYADVTRSLDNRGVEARIGAGAQPRDATDLKDLLANTHPTVRELGAIVKRYQSLGLRKSREKNWDRISFGVKDYGTLRLKLNQHVTAIVAYLDAVGLSALARIERGLEALPQIKDTLDALAAEIRAGRREGSIMTTHADDEKETWRQFRRELIGEGLRSSTIRKFKPQIKSYLRSLAEEGLLEESEPEPASDLTLGENGGQAHADFAPIDGHVAVLAGKASARTTEKARYLEQTVSNAGSRTPDTLPADPIAPLEDKMKSMGAENPGSRHGLEYQLGWDGKWIPYCSEARHKAPAKAARRAQGQEAEEDVLWDTQEELRHLQCLKFFVSLLCQAPEQAVGSAVSSWEQARVDAIDAVEQWSTRGRQRRMVLEADPAYGRLRKAARLNYAKSEDMSWRERRPEDREQEAAELAQLGITGNDEARLQYLSARWIARGQARLSTALQTIVQLGEGGWQEAYRQFEAFARARALARRSGRGAEQTTLELLYRVGVIAPETCPCDATHELRTMQSGRCAITVPYAYGAKSCSRGSAANFSV
ncbi:hypothetical protein LTR53_005147 [Teratosphaeriaceae sp. CCFEE 6253]|nr:hypothetical protein LTR53_005147 [Teratosphaeriaceae sp. CCFEE 6253]